MANQKTPHKHAELIKAWADGQTIEILINGCWTDTIQPSWDENNQYRIKQEPKPNIHFLGTIDINAYKELKLTFFSKPNVSMLFDGDTKKLIQIQLISL